MLHWTRQFAALVLGVAFGLVPVKGIVGVAGGPLLIVITGRSGRQAGRQHTPSGRSSICWVCPPTLCCVCRPVVESICGCGRGRDGAEAHPDGGNTAGHRHIPGTHHVKGGREGGREEVNKSSVDWLDHFSLSACAVGVCAFATSSSSFGCPCTRWFTFDPRPLVFCIHLHNITLPSISSL